MHTKRLSIMWIDGWITHGWWMDRLTLSYIFTLFTIYLTNFFERFSFVRYPAWRRIDSKIFLSRLRQYATIKDQISFKSGYVSQNWYQWFDRFRGHKSCVSDFGDLLWGCSEVVMALVLLKRFTYLCFHVETWIFDV